MALVKKKPKSIVLPPTALTSGVSPAPIVKPPKMLTTPTGNLPVTAPPQAFFGPITPIKLPKVTIPSATKKPAAAGYTPPGTIGQDPFAFIQSMLSSQDPNEIRALIDPIYAPLRQAVLDQIAQSAGAAQARADQMAKIYSQFAQYVGGVGGQIGGGMTDARSAGYAVGQAMVSGMSGPQGEVPAHLQATAQISQSASQAASQASSQATAALPGVFTLYATQQIKQMLDAEGETELQLRQKLLELDSDEAGKIVEYLLTARQNDQALQMWAFEQKQQQDIAAASNAEDWAKFTAAQQTDITKLTAGAMEVDPAVSKLNGFLSNKYGDPILGADKQPIRLATAGSATLKPAPDAFSRSTGYLMGFDVNGNLKAYTDPSGNPIPYKSGSTAKPKDWTSVQVTATNTIASDISNNLFKSEAEATRYYVAKLYPQISAGAFDENWVRQQVSNLWKTTPRKPVSTTGGTRKPNIPSLVTGIRTRIDREIGQFGTMEEAQTRYRNDFNAYIRAGYFTEAQLRVWVGTAWASQYQRVPFPSTAPPQAFFGIQTKKKVKKKTTSGSSGGFGPP